MFRPLIVLAALTLIAGQAGAHFLFVHVLNGENPRIEVHFAESGWDFSADQRMVGLISNIQGQVPGYGKVRFESRPHAMIASMPADGDTASGSFTYGIMRRGGAFLLEYHAKGVSGLEAAATPGALDAEIIAVREGDELVLTVLFRGQPAPGAEIVVPMEGIRIDTRSTDANGRTRIPLPSTPLFSVRAMVSEKQDGIHDDVNYDEVRHYTTLTIHTKPEVDSTGSDALASAILADALACSAGFTADSPKWRGRLQGNFVNEEIRGSVARNGSGLKVALASSASELAKSKLGLLEALDDGAESPLAGARFAPRRTARSDATIVVPDVGLTFIIRDRRIESVVTDDGSGSRRVDVLNWETTDDQRHLPKKILVTEFDPQGVIQGVAIVETGFTLEDGIHLPQSHSGTIIDGPGEARIFSLQVNDINSKGS